jgi:rare lipoprotein A
MRYGIKLACAMPLVALAACSMNGQNGLSEATDAASAASAYQSAADEPVIIGAPFKVGATVYTPQDVPAYDEVGYAGYGEADSAGRDTANGEAFNPAAATAAHKTLPIPSYVEVTALETGRTILVRINDRGPLANDRLIDLSPGAARQLGIDGQAATGVRVRRVNPPEQERAVLRQGLNAAERIETPGPLLKVLRDKLAKLPRPAGATRQADKGVSAPVSYRNETVSEADGRFIREAGGTRAAVNAPSTKPALRNDGNWVVQVAAFSSQASADALAKKIGGNVARSGSSNMFRVQLGPFSNNAEGQRGLTEARRLGYSDARLTRY